MVEEQKEAPETPPVPAKKGGMMKMLMLGGGFLLLTGIVSVSTVFILGTDEPVPAADSTAVDTSKTASTDGPNLENVPTVQKSNQMDELMQNLEILDYKPGPNELTTKDGSMTLQDSVDALTWANREKEKLGKWKKELEVQQAELDKLDKIVSQKLLKVEQVETARVAQLAKLYDGMQPTAVAQLVANLDDKTVVELLPKMNVKQASAVLALLPPIRAAKLSKQMMTIADN